MALAPLAVQFDVAPFATRVLIAVLVIFALTRVPSALAKSRCVPLPATFGTVTVVVLVPRAIWLERVVAA